MANVLEAAAAPAEKVVETIAKPLGFASSVRRVPDWVWIVLTIVVAMYAWRWWQRRRARMAATMATTPQRVATTPVASVPASAVAPLLGAPAPMPTGIALIPKFMQNWMPLQGGPVYSPPAPNGTIY